jgi:hypothetical protein
MLVNLADGKCPTCGGQLNIFFADEATLYVECTKFECLDEFNLEIDAFGDGGITYWPQMMADLANEPEA